MKYRILLLALLFTFGLSACNLPSNAPTQTPTLSPFTPTVTQAPFTETPTVTPLPSNTPPPTATGTPTVPVAFPREQAVNCRLGPGMGWIVLSALNLGTSAQIAGKTADGGWWYIVNPLNSGRKCWVAASVTNTAGNLAGIPVVGAPSASVTNVSVDIDPKTISVAGCMGPIQPSKISGTIEMNGPGTVQWHFETQQDGAMSAKSIDFDTFGSEAVSTDYTPPLTAGTYWARLVVTSPNNMQAEVKYKIECP
jgi:hypothetical protein